MQENDIVAAVERWVETFVVNMNICPFAKRELLNRRVRFVVTDSKTEMELLNALRTEFTLLDGHPSVETTLIIHPQVLHDFYDYNEFLGSADSLLVELKREGVYQIASFHPDYQFSGTEADDVENYTNRSPYPLLHILREDSLERVIADTADVAEIPRRNIELMNTLGKAKLEAVRQACFKGEKNGGLIGIL